MNYPLKDLENTEYTIVDAIFSSHVIGYKQNLSRLSANIELARRMVESVKVQMCSSFDGN